MCYSLKRIARRITLELCDFFGIQPGVTALIGGGGKTSTMYALAEELKRRGSVILCTSTHIMIPPHVPYCKTIDNPMPPHAVVSTGTLIGQKLSLPQQTFSSLCALADYVLVEADGSRQLPLKAHASHEPVIPYEAKRVIAVIGVDGLGKPIREAAHRPELFASLCQTDTEEPVTAEMIYHVVMTYPHFDGIVINKADDKNAVQRALAIAELFSVPTAITAWQTNNPIKRLWRKPNDTD